MRALYILLLVVFCGPASATTVTLDFEKFTIGAGSHIDPGFWFQHGAYEFDGGAIVDSYPENAYVGIGNNGTKVFIAESGMPLSIIIMQRTDGGAFALRGFDLFFGNLPLDATNTIYGTVAGGVAGAADLSVPVGTGDWLNLTQVTFESISSGIGSSSIEIDNIVVTAVPIPAAFWLFGSALAGLGRIRRKQTA